MHYVLEACHFSGEKQGWLDSGGLECSNLFSFVSGGILLLGSGVCSFSSVPDTLAWCDAMLEVIHISAK